MTRQGYTTDQIDQIVKDENKQESADRNQQQQPQEQIDQDLKAAQASRSFLIKQVKLRLQRPAAR